MVKRIFPRKIYLKRLNPKLAFLFELAIFGFFIGLITFLILLLYYAKDLPRPEKFTERHISESTEIYDRTGEILLYTIYGEEKRQVISLDQMSSNIKNAVIAVEDKNFHTHFGIDLMGIARAILRDLSLMRPAQGASTIPQQLIRSTLLTPEKTIERKVREIILSIELDRRYEKNQILEWYLNQVPFGSNAYGVESASKTFFSKKAKDLDIAEAALLASLIQAPSYLSPHGYHVDELMIRKDYVITQMVKEKYITKEEGELAKAQELKFSKTSVPITAPHFVLYVKKYLSEKYTDEYLQTRGLKIYTTLDYELQEKAEQIVLEKARINESFGAYNAALISIDPKTGEILTMVGNKDYFADIYPENCISGTDCSFEPEFNVVTLGKRQPGSAFKPIVYATAFENGYDDQTTVIDEETNFGIWGGEEYVPQNYDGIFRGEVSLRQALAQSLNIPSVKVLVDMAKIKNSVNQAKEMGISTLQGSSFYGPSLVLGGGEVTLLEMTSAYGVFANKGLKVKPTSILRIEDTNGNIIEQNQSGAKRVLNANSAELITSILSDNQARTPMFGPYSALYINDNIAVKTGTTQFYNDAWTVGYNKNIVVGVWVGNNNNESMAKQPGVVLAGPIWNNFIKEAIK